MSHQHSPAGLGLVQVYTGDGKGKTTTALGLALRAAGWGMCSYMGQFMKAQDSGELRSAQLIEPYLTIEQFGQPSFAHLNHPRPEDLELAANGMARVREMMHSGAFQIVIMDEILVACHFKLASVAEVLELIHTRPQGLELVLTGRRAPEEILQVADLVTEMVPRKHPFDTQGTPARQGIEF